MSFEGAIAPSGHLSLVLTRGDGQRVIPGIPVAPSSDQPVRQLIRHAAPQKGLTRFANEWREENLLNVLRGVPLVVAARAARRIGALTAYGALWGVLRKGDTGEIHDLGLMGLKVVTTAGVGYIVDSLQNIVEPENLKFHGYGTGSTAEASGDTALVTELTTEYNPNSTRPTGSLTEGASANIFRTVGTLTPDSGAPVLREHGIFTQAATGGGVLLDRTVFATITVDSATGDSLTTTYDCTFPAGS